MVLNKFLKHFEEDSRAETFFKLFIGTINTLRYITRKHYYRMFLMRYLTTIRSKLLYFFEETLFLFFSRLHI